MARVSLDDMSSAESSKGGSSKKSAGHGSLVGDAGTHKSRKAKGGMDPQQKIKAGIAAAIIVLAGGFIVWNTGMLSGGSGVNPNAAPDATAEQVQQYNDNVKQQEQQQQKSTGSSRLPPMPLGAN